MLWPAHHAARTAVLVPLLVAACGLPGCGDGASDGAESGPPAVQRPGPPRGVVLVSVDTLRADHLGLYGYDRDTSPRLDQLAAESVVFERAIAQAPSTLTSHLALFTSLFPPQFFATADAPVPPEGHVLSQSIATFAQVFQAAGFRTAGHSEGGYVSGRYGFSRGFGEWTDTPYEHSTDIEATVERGLAFLRSVHDGDERFLLFLHTYSVHDPYEPPEPERHRYWPDSAPTTEPASAKTLEASNEGIRPATEAERRYFEARYDGGIRYADRVLGRLWDGLDELGLADDVLVVVTADHGEEFQEHGRFLHSQLYPEHLRVPLIVRLPGTAPRRVARPVRSIDVAPTLLDLADAGELPAASGRSLAPLILETDDPRVDAGAWEPVFAETWVDGVKLSMRLSEIDGSWYWLVREAPRADPEGVWVSRTAELDVEAAVRRLGLRLLAFQQPRRIRLLGADGAAAVEDSSFTAPPGEWTERNWRLPELPDAGFRRLTLEVDGCASPRELRLGDDGRCLGVLVASPSLVVHRAFDLTSDPRALDELATGSELRQALLSRLDECRWQTLADPGVSELSDEERRALESLGYL